MQLHFNEDGCAIDPDSQKMYFDYKKIEPHLIPCTVAPYQRSLRPLVDLWRDVEVISQHNSAATLLTSGAIAMNLHFQALVELKGGAPVVVLYGEPDVEKKTIANAAMIALVIEACSYKGMRQEYFVHLVWAYVQ